ncbi:MAG: hypothetical protein PHE67_13165 [Campylobacterales bacterium]|nr:hypothetical protein [Campylobacterales bacterium]
MNRDSISNLLKQNGYSIHTINAILCGRRKPNAEIRYKLEKVAKIPFSAWLDIKSYLQKEDTKKGGITTTTREQDK